MRIHSNAIVCGLVALSLAFAQRDARASVGDVFGFGSRAAGLAGAASALADGFEATYYNPARVGGAPRFSLGFLAGGSTLSVGGRRQNLDDAFGLVLGAAAPVPLGGALRERVHVGAGFFLLPDKIVRAKGRAPSEAFFPLYDNRTQRVMILPSLAVRLHERLWIGVGANVLAALGGSVDVRDGPLRGLDARVNEELLTTFALTAGVSLKPLPRWTVALSLRDEFALPFFTRAKTTFSGSQLAINIRARTLFEPATVTLGNAYALSSRLRLALDLAYKRWSRYSGGYVAVDGALPVGIGQVADVPLAPPVPEAGFKDVLNVRLGAEWVAYERDPWALIVRGGWSYEPSPVPRQSTGRTFLVDGDKHLIAAGASLLIGRRFQVDAHFTGQHVGFTRTPQPEGASIPVLEGGGAVFSGGLVGSYFFR